MKFFNFTSTTIILLLFVICFVVFRNSSLNPSDTPGNKEELTDNEQFTENEENSVEMQKGYMESFYHPKTIQEIEQERTEYLQSNGTFKNLGQDIGTDDITPWSSVGPMGIYDPRVQPTPYLTGRIISFAMFSDNTNILFVGASSGGLWKSTNGGGSWFKLLDTLSCPSVASIATSYISTDNTVWFSTGAIFMEGFGPQLGRVYKSTNGGESWQRITALPGSINNIPKIEINVFNKNIVYIATNSGLYKTINGGSNFSLALNGTFTDVITYTNLLAADTSNIVAAVIGGTSTGIKRSTNGGLNFYNVTLPGSNPAVMNRITLTRDPATSKTYALVGRNNGKFMGIWYSTDKGATWSQRTFPTSDSGGQSNINQGIAVAPNGRVYVGYNSGNTYYSTNNGTTWQTGGGSHEDVHQIFVYNNSLLFSVNDGGIFKSTDQSVTWTNAGNNSLPITQSYTLTADIYDPNQLWSGLQDDGVIQGYDGFLRWFGLTCCDGGDYLRFINYQYMSVIGLAPNNPYRYQRKLISAPSTAPWDSFSTGLPGGWPTSQSGPNEIIYNSFNIYTSMNQFIYKTSPGLSMPWLQVGARPHPTIDVWVGKFIPLYNYILAGFDQPVNPTLRRYNSSTGNWETPNLTGIPTSSQVTDFAEGNNAGGVFMTISGTGAPRVFKSSNYGSSWINITGDLPNLVNARCILADHTTNDNIIYVGSDFGVFVTSNGGASWFNYSNSLPSVCYVNDIEFAAGHNFIYAATYGRGIWKTSALIGIKNISEIAEKFSLRQNYPNPFNPVTYIEFSVPKQSLVKLVIYDVQGRVVQTLINKELKAGSYKADWDAANYSSGVYFYRIESDGYSDVKKMILLK